MRKKIIWMLLFVALGVAVLHLFKFQQPDADMSLLERDALAVETSLTMSVVFLCVLGAGMLALIGKLTDSRQDRRRQKQQDELDKTSDDTSVAEHRT